MPDPTRPVAGAPIDTDWGQRVHDQTFTPQGTRVAGGAASGVGTTLEQLNLNTAIDDPGGWLASDALTVPADAGGVYLFALSGTSSGGTAGSTNTRLTLRVNGAEVARAQHENEGASAIRLNMAGVLALDAGDVLTVYARNSSASPEADVEVTELALVRLGTELGA